MSLSNGTFPLCWQLSDVVPIIRSDLRTDLIHYRGMCKSSIDGFIKMRQNKSKTIYNNSQLDVANNDLYHIHLINKWSSFLS